ncbi:hypothetical protein BDZ91DRAFT_728927 [Kalaharituber pfeilii]|nr:hypothetical protein BDZ91DRAFT_728927 [Kalaharituber pfeilii]
MGSQHLRGLGNLFIDRMIAPLLYRHQHLRNSPALFNLLLAALRLADFSHLGQLAATLGEIPSLLGKAFSFDCSANLLREWIDVLGRHHPNPMTLANWTGVLADVIKHCNGFHGADEFLEKWKNVQILRQELREAQKAATSVTFEIEFSPQTLDLFNQFNIKCPSSSTALAATLNKVEVTVTTGIMSSLARSMPCRLCFETSTALHPTRGKGVWNGNITDATRVDMAFPSLSFEHILGPSLGLWKICLSAQALKDLESSNSEGNAHMIRAKLEDLSTGDWIRKSVATPVSRANRNLRVPLFTASYCRNGRILWQVDQAYDERIDADSQIVKVWRIGDVKEIAETIASVAYAQRHWPDQRIQDCKAKELDRVRRIKLPASFQEHDTERKRDFPAGPKETLPLNSAIFCKSHAVTTKMLENIEANNVHAEFMLDPDGTETAVIKHFRTAAFILGRSGTGKTTCLLYKLLIRYLHRAIAGNSERRLRQVLLTRSRILAKTLHGKLQRLLKAQLEVFRNSEEEYNALESMPKLVDENAWDGGDPETMKELTSLLEINFPLVCTFDHFLKIVENTVRDMDRQNFRVHTKTNLVDFDIFRVAYWPSMKHPNYLKLDAGRVFSEIMGVIKGCLSSKSGYKPLSRAEYIDRSVRLAPAFPRTNEREVLYDLYEQYEVKKRKRYEYDAMDRVLRILSAFDEKNQGVDLSNLVDEIYVDEVQDQREVEIKLFLSLVQDPRGIHFAGDSAQCISNDSAFRFGNVQTLFFGHYNQEKSMLALAKPKLFTLSHNFRSHQGILGLASFVMSLLWKGFPTMVDKSDPELGEYNGPKPRLIVGSCVQELLALSSKYSSSEGRRDKQTIIVRDSETQSKLLPSLQSNAVVYTVLESKGTEHEEVIVFDFFSSSSCADIFKSLEELLPKDPNYTYAQGHMALCPELKTLYVAITRACSRLLILESSRDQISSIIDLFTNKAGTPLVEVEEVGISGDARNIARELCPLTPTARLDWVRDGDHCMENGLYEQAIRCFKNAEDTDKANLARAFCARKVGRELQARGNLSDAHSHYQEAMELFQLLGMVEEVAYCCESLGDFVRAAEIWSDKGQHERAGDLLAKAGRPYLVGAAEEYYKADLHGTALQLLYEGGLYEKLVEDLGRHQGKILPSERRLRAWQCNDLLRKNKISTDLTADINELFMSENEKAEFLFGYKYFEEYMVTMTRHKRFKEGWHRLIGDAEGIYHALSTVQLQTDPAWHAATFSYFEELYHCLKAHALLDFMSPSNIHTLTDTSNSHASPTEGTWSNLWKSQISKWEQTLKQPEFELPPLAKLCSNSNSHQLIDLICMLIILRPDYFLNAVPLRNRLSAPTVLLEYIHEFTSKDYVHKTNCSPSFPDMVMACLGLLSVPSSERRFLHLPWSSIPANTTPGMTKEFSEHILSDGRMTLRAQICEAVGTITKAARVLLGKVPEWTEAERAAMDKAWGAPLNKSDLKRDPSPNTKRMVCEKIQILSDIDRIQTAVQENCTGVRFDRSKFMSNNVRDEIVLEFLKFQSPWRDNPSIFEDIVRKLRTAGCYPILKSLRAKVKKSVNQIAIIDEPKLAVVLRNYRLCTLLSDAKNVQSMMDDLQLIFEPEKDSPWLMRPGMKIFSWLYHYHSLKYLTEAHSGWYLNNEGLFLNQINEMVADLLVCLGDFIEEGKVSLGVDILSLYEDIATLLLLCRHRNQTLFPQSWKARYLSQWLGAIAVANATSPSGPSFELALHRLACNLCKLLKVKSHEDYPSEFHKLLDRRSVDFLVIMLLNCGSTTPGLQSSDYSLFKHVQEVFENGTLAVDTNMIRNKHGSDLLTALLNAFMLYHEDYICIYEFPAAYEGETPHFDLTHLPRELERSIKLMSWPECYNMQSGTRNSLRSGGSGMA